MIFSWRRASGWSWATRRGGSRRKSSETVGRAIEARDGLFVQDARQRRQVHVRDHLVAAPDEPEVLGCGWRSLGDHRQRENRDEHAVGVGGLEGLLVDHVAGRRDQQAVGVCHGTDEVLPVPGWVDEGLERLLGERDRGEEVTGKQDRRPVRDPVLVVGRAEHGVGHHPLPWSGAIEGLATGAAKPACEAPRRVSSLTVDVLHGDRWKLLLDDRREAAEHLRSNASTSSARNRLTPLGRCTARMRPRSSQRRSVFSWTPSPRAACRTCSNAIAVLRTCGRSAVCT